MVTGKFVDLKLPLFGHFEFDQVEICYGTSIPETAHFVHFEFDQVELGYGIFLPETAHFVQ